MASESPKSVLCVSEDRYDCEPPVWLLMASIRRHYPAGCPFAIRLFLPKASAELRQALAELGIARCEIILDYASPERSWDVKPAVLQLCLEEFDEVLWVDSDIILHRSLDSFFPNKLGPQVLLGTEEPAISPYHGSHFRTRQLGLKPGRELTTTLNSGMIRVTRHHLPLLAAWKLLLRSDVYTKEQKIPKMKRWVHLLSDQDLLTGILGSEEFADLSVKLLRSDLEIVQLYGPAGYTVAGRLLSRVRPAPCAIHAMAKKPWHNNASPSLFTSPGQWYAALCSELSPYTVHALTYAGPAPLAGRFAWLTRKTPLGHCLKTIMFHDPAWSGIVLAAVDSSVRRIKRLFKQPFRTKELAS
jgi:hypothetical protein